MRTRSLQAQSHVSVWAMATSADLVSWAKGLAERLEEDMHWVPSEGGYGGFWQADRAELKIAVHARATSALDFLQRFAGRESQWSIRAERVFEHNRQSMESGARTIANLLREWILQVEAGSVVPRVVEAQGVRTLASTDLMEQVRVLVGDQTVHPAAPIVLAGAALEVALRSAIDELGVELKERPSISAFARRLRAEEILSVQDLKDVEQMAGVRNAAAHGMFDELSRERAGLLEQQVNLFLRRLSDHLERHR